MAKPANDEAPAPTPAPEPDSVGLQAIKRVLLESKAREANLEVQLEIARIELQRLQTELAEFRNKAGMDTADLTMVEDLDTD